MSLVQLATRRGRIDKVAANDEPPVVELHVEPYERIVSLDLRQHPLMKGRTTVDWSWTAVIEVRL